MTRDIGFSKPKIRGAGIFKPPSGYVFENNNWIKQDDMTDENEQNKRDNQRTPQL